MKAIIVSDLHIGSRFFLFKEFEGFIKRIPSGYDLILNGDIIDNPKKHLQVPHQRIVERIEELSYRQRVVWVMGNHDNGYISKVAGRIEFKPIHTMRNRLLIAHGHDFDEIMPRNQTFMKVFKMMHNLRIYLGARPVHVANYAKKWKPFYRVLRNNVMKNAVMCAKANGHPAVTSGHTHFAEDRMFNGVRYINTGSWTEYPPYYLSVEDNQMNLIRLKKTTEEEFK